MYRFIFIRTIPIMRCCCGIFSFLFKIAIRKIPFRNHRFFTPYFITRWLFFYFSQIFQFSPTEKSGDLFSMNTTNRSILVLYRLLKTSQKLFVFVLTTRFASFFKTVFPIVIWLCFWFFFPSSFVIVSRSKHRAIKPQIYLRRNIDLLSHTVRGIKHGV